MVECSCYDRATTVPVYRDQFTHLSDCPFFGMHAMPVGVVVDRVIVPVTFTHSAGGDSDG